MTAFSEGQRTLPA